MLPQALRPTPGSLLLLSLAPGLAVITNQGPWGEKVEEEVREFTGWLRGGEQDYVMTLAQVFTKSGVIQKGKLLAGKQEEASS